MPRSRRTKIEGGVLYLKCSAHPLRNLWLPSTAFYRDAKAKDGFKSRCKACTETLKRGVPDLGAGRYKYKEHAGYRAKDKLKAGT